MSEPSILQQGLDLMIYGMGIVFLFLVVLVTAVAAMSRAIQRYLPHQESLPPSETSPARTAASPQVVRVIQAALDQHRRRK